MDAGEIAVAVVGAGGWGRNHVRTWEDLGNLRLVCDLDPQRREDIRSTHPGVLVVDSYEDVLRRSDIDAIVLATPATTHARLGLRALAAGKHVLIEKPLAVTLREAEELADCADAMKRTLMVGHVLEYHPAVVELRRLINDGDLGRLRYIYSNRLNFGKVRTEEDTLWSFAPHDLALCLRMTGMQPATVSCKGASYLSEGIADVTVMSLSFPQGVAAHIFVSWLHPFKEHRFVVIGEKQMAVFDDTAPWGDKLVLYPHEVSWRNGSVPEARRADGVPVPLEPREPLIEECRSFLEAIRLGIPPLTDGQSGVAVLRILEAGDRSMRLGGAPQPLTDPPTASSAPYVHPTASVDGGARIGADSKIWHHAHVMADAEVGAECSLGQNVFIGRGVRVGNRVKIQNNVSVFEGVELADDVFCGPSMVFTNVLNPRAAVDRKDEFLSTRVCRGASIGANATVVCGTTIEEYALVGAGAVVTHDVPAHALVVGVPARQIGWVCACGEVLRDVEPPCMSCPRCGDSYVLSEGRLERTA